MYQRRPDWLQAEVEAVFEFEKAGTAARYYNQDGRLETYDWAFAGYDSSDDLLAATEDALGHRPRVLEFGPGLGAFMLRLQKQDYDVQGISGIDYKSREAQTHMSERTLEQAGIPHQLQAGTYLTGDLHTLLETPGLETPVGAIFAKDVMYHLVDPLSVLEQALNIVEVGGKVALRELMFLPHLHRRHKAVKGSLTPQAPQDFTMADLLAVLADQGFGSNCKAYQNTNPHGQLYSETSVDGLVLHREEDHGLVRLPIGYAQEDDWHWRYELAA